MYPFSWLPFLGVRLELVNILKADLILIICCYVQYCLYCLYKKKRKKKEKKCINLIADLFSLQTLWVP